MGSMAAVKCERCEKPMPEGRARCPSCKKWNLRVVGGVTDASVLLSSVQDITEQRILSGPWDYCFGGGIVRSSATLFGGSPGAGKTTLLLQLAGIIAGIEQGETMYVAAEQSLPELKMTAQRIQVENMNKVRMIPAMGHANENIGSLFYKYKPKLVIIDSLQGLIGDDMPLSLKMCELCKQHAVALGCPFIIISQVNKGLELQGLMSLQHAVDTTMTFFPDDEDGTRILNVEKNRFGADVAMRFKMTERGLIAVIKETEET